MKEPSGLQDQDLGLLQEYVEEFVRLNPLKRECKVDRPYTFTLTKRGEAVEVVIPTQTDLGLYRKVRTQGSRLAEGESILSSDAARVLIKQPDCQLVLTFETGYARWLPLYGRTEIAVPVPALFK